MQLHELILILSVIGLLFGAPIYIFFRKKMLQNPAENGFNKRRVFKIVAINIILNITASLTFILILVSMLSGQWFIGLNKSILIITIIYLIIIGLCSYGNGMYITSVVIETFTPPALRGKKSFKTQFIATHLFHGPISHILIYSGYIIVLFLLGVIDFDMGNTTSLLPWIMVICGLCAGVIYSAAQNFNGTILYQWITALITGVIFISTFFTEIITSLFEYSFATFYFFFSLAFLMTSLGYLFLRKRRGENLWDMSGYLHSNQSDLYR